jgi:hypothetical protein
MKSYPANSITRDEPVENIRMFFPDDGIVYYQCSVCKMKLLFPSAEATENFFDDHEHCGETA